jgi:release factor glutamine methyltransferase
MNTAGAPRSIAATIADARERLVQAGIDRAEAALDARLLAQHALGWDTVTLLTRDDQPFPPELLSRFDAEVSRRATREPSAYITGEREFWGLSFAVTPDVLIPRPETELLVEQTLTRVDGTPRMSRVLDLCTGSGAVAVALAVAHPAIRVVATDISLAALEVARRNAARHGVLDRVSFVCGDLASPINGRVDVITANPPYIPESDRPGLAPEVRDYEPGLALFAGSDGLDVVRRILDAAPRLLSERGHLLIEHGCGQENAIAGLISQHAGLRMEASVRDLQQIPRVAVVTLGEHHRV